MATRQRHFPYQHPTFGTARNPKTASYWKRSVYYWWWEYLRRSEDYRKTVTSDGDGPLSDLYRDFGDVINTDFKTWWSTDERGAFLFAQPPARSIRVVDGETGFLQESNTLVIEIPLELPKSHLAKRFRQILAERHDGKAGHRYVNVTGPKYPVTGKVDVKFLEVALQVWDLRKQEPAKPLWQIGNELRVGSRLNHIKRDDKGASLTDKKNVLAATTSRYLRKADTMINNVGRGVFPSSSSLNKAPY